MFGDLRVRYFGPRPLLADDLVRSPATHVVNAQAGYRFSNGLRLGVETFNLFNNRASDVDYYYVSRLPGEPSNGVADIHTHPITPRTARLTLQLAF
jgi:outer membrane receptor protein involved in Fe transport